MVENGLDMVAGRIPLSLAALRHHVADVYFHGIAGRYGVYNAVHQQVGDDAGIQAARGKHDEVCLTDGLHRLRQGLSPIRVQPDLADTAALLPLHLADTGFALNHVSIFKFRLQTEIGIGHR